MNWFAKVTGWIKSVASEPNGSGSSSRIALLMIAATICGLLIAYFRYHAALPDHDTLYGLASILTAIVGGYGINKWTNKDGGPPPQ